MKNDIHIETHTPPPSAEALISVIAKHYGCSRKTAAEWLASVDRDALRAAA